MRYTVAILSKEHARYNMIRAEDWKDSTQVVSHDVHIYNIIIKPKI